MENEYIEISSGCWLRRDEIKGFRIVYNEDSDEFALCMLIPSGIDRGCCSREVFTWETFGMYDSSELAEIAMEYLLENKRVYNVTAVMLQILEDNENISPDEKDMLEEFMFDFDDDGDYVFCPPTKADKDVLYESIAVSSDCGCGNLDKIRDIIYNSYLEIWDEADSTYKKMVASEE